MPKPDPADDPATCIPVLLLRLSCLEPLRFLFKAVALESTAFSSSAGAFSGGGGGVTVGAGATALGDDIHII